MSQLAQAPVSAILNGYNVSHQYHSTSIHLLLVDIYSISVEALFGLYVNYVKRRYYFPDRLFICFSVGLLKYYCFDLRKNHKVDLGSAYNPFNFESDLDHHL